MRHKYIFFCLLVFSGCITTGGYGSFVPGVWHGEASGYYGKIVVEVETDGAGIIDIRVTEQNEDPFIGAQAIEALRDLVLEEGSVDADVVSGATISSEAFLNAVDEALFRAAKAKNYSHAFEEGNTDKLEGALKTD